MTSPFAVPRDVAATQSPVRYDRVVERRAPWRWHATTARSKASPLLRSPGASAARRRRSRLTSTTPAGEKARAVKARYLGVCRGCGTYTQPRNGKGDAYAYCEACHPGAVGRRWTRELVLEAMIE